MRLIDADVMRTNWLIGGLNAYVYDTNAVLDSIDAQPTIEAEPVRHGRWVDHMVRDWRCSECGEKIKKVRNVDGYCYDDKPNYCPNCGAKMDGVQE